MKEIEGSLEEIINGTGMATLPVNGPFLERLAALFSSQLETPDFHCCLTQPVRLSDKTVLIPHLQITAEDSQCPALIVECYNSESRSRLSLRLTLYERYRLREYWAIDLDSMELDRYILLEGFFLPPHSFHLRHDKVFSVVFSELQMFPSFFE